MKRVGLALLVALGACFSPDDILVVDGTVATAEPEGVPVRMLRGRHDDADGCDRYTPFKETTTDADGAFRFEVFRAQAQSLTGLGGDFCFRVEVDFASGSRAATEVHQLFGPETLPPLPDWRPAMQLDAGTLAFVPVVALPAEEALDGDQVTHRLEARTADGGLAWRQDDRVLELSGPGEPRATRVPLTFDEAVLVEDEALTLRLLARVEQAEAGQGPFAGGTVLSAAVEVEAGEAVAVPARAAPPSRGLPCAGFGTPCALTDGDLAPVEPSGFARALALDFAPPLSPRWAVLRGLEADVALFGVTLLDADGGVAYQAQHLAPESLWNPAAAPVDLPAPDGGVGRRGEARLRFLAIPLDAGVPVSGLRVSQPKGGVRWAAELSVIE